jgi:hypothetical protein
MARQYLGCPASSATVERLFSQVGLAFTDQRKNASPATIADIIFTKLNMDCNDGLNSLAASTAASSLEPCGRQKRVRSRLSKTVLLTFNNNKPFIININMKQR